MSTIRNFPLAIKRHLCPFFPHMQRQSLCSHRGNIDPPENKPFPPLPPPALRAMSRDAAVPLSPNLVIVCFCALLVGTDLKGKALARLKVDDPRAARCHRASLPQLATFSHTNPPS